MRTLLNTPIIDLRLLEEDQVRPDRGAPPAGGGDRGAGAGRQGGGAGAAAAGGHGQGGGPGRDRLHLRGRGGGGGRGGRGRSGGRGANRQGDGAGEKKKEVLEHHFTWFFTVWDKMNLSSMGSVCHCDSFLCTFVDVAQYCRLISFSRATLYFSSVHILAIFFHRSLIFFPGRHVRRRVLRGGRGVRRRRRRTEEDEIRRPGRRETEEEVRQFV